MKAHSPMAKMAKVTKKIEIPSDTRYIKKVSQEILNHLQHRNIDKAIQFDVRLAAEEAIRNSIEHGHECHKKLPVRISYIVDEDRVEIEVEDKGEGFNPAAIPDPTTEDNIMRGGGRGVFLIYKMMDKVTYNEKGNKVRMVKFFK